MNHTPTISLCMIVKDEETYLAQCFDSVKDIVDEIIVVDTGSTDQTKDICDRYHVRLYSFTWDNDFSNARNYSLQYAQSDWILILDADEMLDSATKVSIKPTLQDATTDSYIIPIYNYTGVLVEDEYSIHHALRLFRNHRGFCFQGAIHEQVVLSGQPENPISCEFARFIIHHYGYLAKVIDAKGKRSRNLPLLIKQLEAEPNNAFILFNLGNEYAALDEYDQALSCYQLAKLNLPDQAAYAAYLHFRLVLCYSNLSRNQEAVCLALDLLKEFPDFTDLVYCLGLAYYHMHQYTKALEAFDQCIRMGPSSPLLTFLHGGATFLPYEMKAEIYRRLNDLEAAIESLSKAYQYKNGNSKILYDIGHLMNQVDQDKDMVLSNLLLISKMNEKINLYECADILINEQLYSVADSFLSTLNIEHNDMLFLSGKLSFFTHDFTQASQYFQQVVLLSRKQVQRIESLSYLFVIGTLTRDVDIQEILLTLEEEACQFEYQFYQNISQMQFNQETSKETLPLLIGFLEKLLKLQVFEQFEAYLPLIDQINNNNNNNNLLELGRLYERCGYSKLAQTTYYRSLKEANVIDMEALDYLASGLMNL